MVCERLHRLFNSFNRHGFPFDETRIPVNGIYILFERGELAHGELQRIVRVGTHTGQSNLRQRLAEHFLVENKDRSIFRKNIGRAILNRGNDPFLPQWEKDLTTRAARQRLESQIDHDRLAEIEAEVSSIIRNSFTFCVFRVDDCGYRLELEGRIIAAVNQCPDCRPSGNWLGNYSPKEKIRKCGLWLVLGLNGRGLRAEDLMYLDNKMETVEQPGPGDKK
jgi:hypothetical protein